MRTIKFKGKSKIDGKIIFGELSKMWNGLPFIMPKCYYATKDLGFEDIEDIKNNKKLALGGFIEVEKESVGQFTNFFDAKGNEIYEGENSITLEIIGLGKDKADIVMKDGTWCVFEKSQGYEALNNLLNNISINIISEIYPQVSEGKK